MRTFCPRNIVNSTGVCNTGASLTPLTDTLTVIVLEIPPQESRAWRENVDRLTPQALGTGENLNSMNREATTDSVPVPSAGAPTISMVTMLRSESETGAQIIASLKGREEGGSR